MEIKSNADLVEYLKTRSSGHNKAEIGRAVGLSRSMICKLMHGDRNFTSSTLVKLAEYFGDEITIKERR